MPIAAILFDLDNTLYPASSGLMRAVDTRINDYVQQVLKMSPEESAAIRREYFESYGTTLRGLQQHHQVDTEAYLHYVHDIAFESFLASDAELDHLLGQLTATRAIFTNSNAEYANRVLRTLGIEHYFAYMFDIRFFEFIPKPHLSSYQRALNTLNANGDQVILVEDTAQNLPPARDLGMTTILVGPGPDSVADYVVPDVLAAIRIALELEKR